MISSDPYEAAANAVRTIEQKGSVTIHSSGTGSWRVTYSSRAGFDTILGQLKQAQFHGITRWKVETPPPASEPAQDGIVVWERVETDDLSFANQLSTLLDGYVSKNNSRYDVLSPDSGELLLAVAGHSVLVFDPNAVEIARGEAAAGTIGGAPIVVHKAWRHIEWCRQRDADQLVGEAHINVKAVKAGTAATIKQLAAKHESELAVVVQERDELAEHRDTWEEVISARYDSKLEQVEDIAATLGVRCEQLEQELAGAQALVVDAPKPSLRTHVAFVSAFGVFIFLASTGGTLGVVALLVFCLYVMVSGRYKPPQGLRQPAEKKALVEAEDPVDSDA